jgi:[acyl-carrier-protein] S-malonyltransferase
VGKIAFVFAGQGAQYGGMGQSLYQSSPAARAVLDQAETLRKGTLEQCFAGTKETLNLTINAQPCLMAVDCACAAALMENGIHPDGLAGFSLGEIAALAVSGMLPFPQAFELVTMRAEFMHACAEKHPGGMAAVLKLEDERVQALCGQFGAYPVNYNCPGQVVCAMAMETMAPFAEAVRAAGGRAIPLNVSGGFHSPFMRDAAAKLGTFLTHYHFSEPTIPLYANVTCEPYAAKEAGALLSMQVDHPVRWTTLILNMLHQNYTDFIEVGAGTVLSGLIQKIGGAQTILHTENGETLQSVAKHYRECLPC